METSNTLTAYAIYLPTAIFLTLIVSRILFRNGRIFMLDIFHGRAEIASATSKLFETGFYLLNIGFALKILEINLYTTTYREMVVALSSKIGGFSIYLGIMLFLNLYMFFRGKRKANDTKLPIETYAK